MAQPMGLSMALFAFFLTALLNKGHLWLNGGVRRFLCSHYFLDLRFFLDQASIYTSIVAFSFLSFCLWFCSEKGLKAFFICSPTLQIPLVSWPSILMLRQKRFYYQYAMRSLQFFLSSACGSFVPSLKSIWYVEAINQWVLSAFSCQCYRNV